MLLPVRARPLLLRPGESARDDGHPRAFRVRRGTYVVQTLPSSTMGRVASRRPMRPRYGGTPGRARVYSALGVDRMRSRVYAVTDASYVTEPPGECPRRAVRLPDAWRFGSPRAYTPSHPRVKVVDWWWSLGTTPGGTDGPPIRTARNIQRGTYKLAGMDRTSCRYVGPVYRMRVPHGVRVRRTRVPVRCLHFPRT